jgi:hypothetical protein
LHGRTRRRGNNLGSRTSSGSTPVALMPAFASAWDGRDHGSVSAASEVADFRKKGAAAET